MTNEEARAYFINCNERIISVAKDENIYNYETKQIEDVFMRRTFEANELAIKALAQKPCDDCCNGNQIEKAKLCQKSYLAGMEHKQESFDDIILTLTKRVVTQVTEDMDNFIFTTIKPWCEAKEQREISKRDLEQALTQYFSKEPCKDAISRQAAIDAIYARYIGGKEAVDKAPANDQYAEGIDEAVCAVEDLPPVTPQPKDNIKGFCEIAGNLTNGDVIKAIFPNIDDCFSNVIDLNLWWKSTYKGVKE